VNTPDTVLVVDDTPSKRYVLASWLRRGGYAVLEADTGTAALARVAAGGVDLVVLDVRLPDLSGFEVCETIKSDPLYGTTPVIHVSAAAVHSEDRTHGLVRGADAYLTEPIDPDELLATVASILRYYQARIQAERLAERLAALAGASVAMGAAADHRSLLSTAARGAAAVFAAPAVVIAAGPDGARLAAIAADAGQPASLRPWTAEATDAPIGMTITQQSPQRWPAAPWPGGDTLRVVALRSRLDRPASFLVVPASASEDAGPVLTLFGQALVGALDRLWLHQEERDVTLTLQRSLLPRHLPYVSGMDLAVRYVPASEWAEIGGDFYEVTRLRDKLMVAVGDVGGHSLHAATVMAEVRHATRAYLAQGYGPAAVLDRLNTLMTELLPGEIATMCLLAIDVKTGHTVLANAGHPPPVVHRASGVSLVEERSPLLGLPTRPAVEVELDLGPGESLVLYTDGLIETRGEHLDVSIARLCRAVATVEPDLEVFADRLLDQVGPGEPTDDIALVAVRRRG
jgi:CheY-like chemotaxis protein